MPVADYWGFVLEDLGRIVSPSNYKAWLENLEFISVSVRGTRLNLSTASRFSKEYIEKKLLKQLTNSVQKYFPRVAQINFEIRRNTQEKKENNSELVKIGKQKQPEKNLENNISNQISVNPVSPISASSDLILQGSTPSNSVSPSSEFTQSQFSNFISNPKLTQNLEKIITNLVQNNGQNSQKSSYQKNLIPELAFDSQDKSQANPQKSNIAFQPLNSVPSKKIPKNKTENKIEDNLSTDLTQIPKVDNSQTNFDQKDWQNPVKNNEPSALPSPNLNNLNPKYTFENLVVSGHNELAVSVAKSILREMGTLYNPVFIHSKVGLGKTHLLQAIGQKALENEPSLKIKYATCETFFNHYLTAIQKNQSAQFRHYYRNVDLLLLDDIQFINGKNSTQEAFFHTFNELHQQNKQIIITSDKPPEMLGLVEDRLVSRFKWGMVVDIMDPNLEDRLAILKDKIERLQIILSTDQILQIAQTVTTNVRDIEGVLNQIVAKLKMTGQREMEQKWLDKILKTENFETETVINKSPEKVLQIVAKLHSTTQSEIIGKSRDKNVSTARQIIMYLWHKNFGLSLPIIGKMLKRDHTTILHGTQKIQKEIQNDPQIAIKIKEILKTLEA
jgi:chromosomal replication initiator protein